MPASLVPTRRLKRLQAWRLAAVRVSNAVGPAAGALLIAQGASTAFTVIAFAFAASVILLPTLHMRPVDDAATPAAPRQSPPPQAPSSCRSVSAWHPHR